MSGDPLRIGVLGAARITALSLIGPAQATGDRLVAVAARDRSRAEAFAARHGVERVVDSYAALLDDPEVEVVYNRSRTRGTAYAPEFARPHLGDTIEVTGPDGTRVEELGRRSSYTYQLEALAAHLRDGTPLLTDADDAVASMELVDEVYRTAGLSPRPRSAPVGMTER